MSVMHSAPFHGATCQTYPNCQGGCGLGCRHEVECDAPQAALDDHKWLDPECGQKGCQSLVWKSRYESAVKGRQEFRQAYREARTEPRAAAEDPLADLVDRFSKSLLAKIRLAQANGRSGWDLDDWETQCREGLLRHVEKGDPRDVAAYCAFMWHHGWATKSAAPQAVRQPTLGEIERALCCPGGCLRDKDDCFVNGNTFGRSKREREQARAIIALLGASLSRPK
jgi:hypothetical protein